MPADTAKSASFGEPGTSHRIGIDARKINDFGIGTYIRNLVSALGRLDHVNEYVLFVGKEGREELEDELAPNFTTAVESAPYYSMRELATLSWRLKRKRVDLYHATHYVLPALLPCPAVVTIHDIIHLLYPEFLPGPLALAYAQRMIRSSLMRSRRVIADSRNTKTDLMGYFNVDGRRIRVIYPGVSEVFRQRLSADELDERLGRLGIQRPYLLFVGNPKPHKNLDNVVKALAKAIHESGVEGTLVCVGNRGSGEFKIRQRAAQLGIADRIRLMGHVEAEALPAIYQGAVLFLYPTLYEGFGLPVVEAMASGAPVITSNTSALNEVADGYAHLVSPMDVDEIAGAIEHCLRDEEYRKKLSLLGRKRAEDFRWDVAAQQTLEVYASALRSDAALRARRRKGLLGRWRRVGP